jgi:hypothetical protein
LYARLKEKMDAFAARYRALEKRAIYYDLLLEALCGYVATFETTIGRNGHHPHWHVLVWMPSLELAKELQSFIRTELCDEKLGAVGVERAAEIIHSNDMPRLISYVQKSMFEATGVSKTVHKNGNVGLFDLSTDWHVRMYAEVHTGTKGKRLFRSGGAFKDVEREAEERMEEETPERSATQTVAQIVTHEDYDPSEIPRGAVVLYCDTPQRLKMFCMSGGVYDCIEVLRKSSSVEQAREGIGKIFEAYHHIGGSKCNLSPPEMVEKSMCSSKIPTIQHSQYIKQRPSGKPNTAREPTPRSSILRTDSN